MLLSCDNASVAAASLCNLNRPERARHSRKMSISRVCLVELLAWSVCIKSVQLKNADRQAANRMGRPRKLDKNDSKPAPGQADLSAFFGKSFRKKRARSESDSEKEKTDVDRPAKRVECQEEKSSSSSDNATASNTYVVSSAQQNGPNKEEHDSKKSVVNPNVNASKSSLPLSGSTKRHFQDSWRLSYPWLIHDKVNGKIKCESCISAGVSNSFTRGTSIKLDNINKHLASKGNHSHKAALEKLKQADALKQTRVGAVQKNQQAAICALRNVYFLAKHNLPNHLLQDLNKLCKLQGVEVLQKLEVDKHTSYTHSTSISEMQKAICDVLDAELCEKLQVSEYFSIMIDESTDLAVNQNMLVYIRFAYRGTAKTHFLTVQRVKKADAQTLFLTVCDVLKEKGLQLEFLVAIATDGAATMIGRKSGVVTRLKQEIPYLTSVHCIAHRLALASAQAADAVPYLVKFQDVINTIYKYFEKSPKNMARLEDVQDILKEAESENTAKSKRFHQVFGTRWLSFEGSLDALLKNYSALLSVLQEDKSAKGQGLLKQTSSCKFLHVASFMADAMCQLCTLSRAFQKDNLDCSVINYKIESCIDALEGLLKSPGVNFSKFKEIVPGRVQEIDGKPAFEKDGHLIRDSEKDRTEAERCCQIFIDIVTENLKNRFLDEEDTKTVLGAFSKVFDPKNYPECVNLDEETYQKFGEGEMRLLSNHFKDLPGFKSECAQQEYAQFKSLVVKCMRQNAGDMQQLCKAVLLGHSAEFPHISTLAKVALCIPVSTVSVERGFSQQNLIKTRTRTRLGTGNLDKLMRICIEGPKMEEMDYEEAFKAWASASSRRLLTSV